MPETSAINVAMARIFAIFFILIGFDLQNNAFFSDLFPIFANNFEKYEWLMSNGCTNSEDRKWLTDYIRSDEYMNLYGD